MKNYKLIETGNVWTALQFGKQVYAVILPTNIWTRSEGVFDLTNEKSPKEINELLTKENIAFYMKEEK